jgi:ElaB/YqjD/DUF883 family membrane-anchored ribosome-binding protein
MPHSRSRMQSMASDARHGMDDVMTMAADQGRRAMNAMGHAVGEYGSTVQHTGEMVAEEAARRIRDYPLATVFAAAALGLFTGFLLSRR